MTPFYLIIIGLTLGILISLLNCKRLEIKRKHSEKELSLDFYLAFKANNIYVWKFDVETQEAHFIRGTFNGYSKVSFESCREFMHPDDRKLHGEIYDDFVNGKINQTRVDLRFMIDGEYRILRTVMIAKRTKYGKLAEVIGSFFDVTKEVENEAKAQELLYQNHMILNNINCGLLFISNEDKILWENENNPNNPLSYCMECKRDNLYDCKECATFRCKKTKKIEVSERTINDKKISINGIPIFDKDKYVGTVVRVDKITGK